MTEVYLQQISKLRQQIFAETSRGFVDWNLVQILLDELMINHRQYKHFAAQENKTIY